MNIKTIVYVCFAAPLAALAASSVTSITVQQRYPWNGMMDITCNVTSGASLCRLSFSATANGESIPMQSVALEGGTVTNSTLSVAPGTRKFVWNAAADLPKGFSASNVKIGVVAKDAAATDCTYLVIDISGGQNATSYPVTGMNEVPSQGWESYGAKTTKLVFRRCEPGTFMMLGLYTTTLTKPFYMGVYPLTRDQIASITGTSGSGSLELGSLALEDVRGDGQSWNSTGNYWPYQTSVHSAGLIGLLRTKSKLKTIDLPTEAQWEYACRAGTTTLYNTGSNSASTVDNTKPNKWGMYLFHGHWEMCLDLKGPLYAGGVDPVGPDDPPLDETQTTIYGDSYRIYRGGTNKYGKATSCTRISRRGSYGGKIRLCIPVELR